LDIFDFGLFSPICPGTATEAGQVFALPAMLPEGIPFHQFKISLMEQKAARSITLSLFDYSFF